MSGTNWHIESVSPPWQLLRYTTPLVRINQNNEVEILADEQTLRELVDIVSPVCPALVMAFEIESLRAEVMRLTNELRRLKDFVGDL